MILNLCLLKCSFCGKNLDRQSALSHVQLCCETKTIGFDVSYEYNGRGEIQFIVDVNLDDQGWTIRKTEGNIIHFLNRRGLKSPLFNNVHQVDEDIALNEQRRIFLDEVFHGCCCEIWSNTFLIEYFAIDLNFLNCMNEKFKYSSMKGSKISLDL
jgi:hypothetical protein